MMRTILLYYMQWNIRCAVHFILTKRVDSRTLCRLSASGHTVIKQFLRSFTLANSAQAKKRARQAEKSRQRNAAQRSEMRTYMKNTLKAIEAGDKEAANSAFKQAIPEIDKLARKGLIHANKAARHKSRINARLKAMA